MTVKIPVEETSVYENLIGEKKTDNEPISLLDHMDLEDEEREKFSANNEKEWQKYWVGMPEFEQEENPTFKTLYVHFRSEEDYNDFAKLIGQNLTKKTKSIWHPHLDRTQNSLLRWIEEE